MEEKTEITENEIENNVKRNEKNKNTRNVGITFQGRM